MQVKLTLSVRVVFGQLSRQVPEDKKRGETQLRHSEALQVAHEALQSIQVRLEANVATGQEARHAPSELFRLLFR